MRLMQTAPRPPRRRPDPRPLPAVEPPPALGVRVERVIFSDGRAGVGEKLRLLARLVREDRLNPRVRGLAAAIFRRGDLDDPRDYLARAAALLAAVQPGGALRFVYVHEPVETFTRPARTLLHPAWRFGDCDEQNAAALAALYESVGYPTRLVGVVWPGGGHVFLEVGVPPGHGRRGARRWLAAEGTRRVPLGWSPLAHIEERLTRRAARA